MGRTSDNFSGTSEESRQEIEEESTCNKVVGEGMMIDRLRTVGPIEEDNTGGGTREANDKSRIEGSEAVSERQEGRGATGGKIFGEGDVLVAEGGGGRGKYNRDGDLAFPKKGGRGGGGGGGEAEDVL